MTSTMPRKIKENNHNENERSKRKIRYNFLVVSEYSFVLPESETSDRVVLKSLEELLRKTALYIPIGIGGLIPIPSNKLDDKEFSQIREAVVDLQNKKVAILEKKDGRYKQKAY